MNTAVLSPAPIDPADRLAATLCLALIIHVMIVLGVSFRPELRPPAKPESLEITLVTEHSAHRPKQADALAQANLEGGGDSEGKFRPASPVAAPLPAPVPAVATASPDPGEVEETPSPPVPATAPPSPAPTEATATPKPATAPARVATQTHSNRPKLQQAAPTPVPAPPAPVAEAQPEPAPAAGSDTDEAPTATQLITRSFAMASMSAELQDKLETRAKRPRSKYISASTQEYRYAAYMEAWRAKVERIGNINYPDDARDSKLSGSLLLDVSLRPDGSVIEIVVRRSSGHKVLDDGAVRIVQLASPYAPFPPDIAREVDVLHVTRTWRFLNSSEFSAQ